MIVVSEEEVASKAQSSRLASFYKGAKFICALLLTVILLVPVIFIVGSEQTFHSHQPINQLLAQSSAVRQLQTRLSSKIDEPGSTFEVFNLHLSEGDEKKSAQQQKEEGAMWDNLKQAGSYLGYLMNEQGLAVVNKVIRYPSENVTKSQHPRRLVKKAYDLNKPANTVIYLKHKLLKMLKNTARRLKWKKSNDDSISTSLKNYILNLIQQEQSKKVWIVVLNHKDQEYHHSPTFFKKLTEWRKNYPEHKMIVVSKKPLDKNSSKIVNFEVGTKVPQSKHDEISKNADNDLNQLHKKAVDVDAEAEPVKHQNGSVELQIDQTVDVDAEVEPVKNQRGSVEQQIEEEPVKHQSGSVEQQIEAEHQSGSVEQQIEAEPVKHQSGSVELQIDHEVHQHQPQSHPPQRLEPEKVDDREPL